MRCDGGFGESSLDVTSSIFSSRSGCRGKSERSGHPDPCPARSDQSEVGADSSTVRVLVQQQKKHEKKKEKKQKKESTTTALPHTAANFLV